MKTSPSPPIKYSSVGSNWPHTDGLLSIQENETYSASEQFYSYVGEFILKSGFVGRFNAYRLPIYFNNIKEYIWKIDVNPNLI